MLKFARLAAVAAVALAAGAANAATTVIDFNNGTAENFSGSYTIYNTGIVNVAAAVNDTPFLAVPQDGQRVGTATYTSANRITGFSFDWGTPDSYNTLTFLNGTGGTVNPTVTGGGLAAGRYTYTFADSDNVRSVNFGTTERAFEIDNLSVTAVPEPASWALMLVGFAMVGASVRRRSTNVVAA